MYVLFCTVNFFKDNGCIYYLSLYPRDLADSKGSMDVHDLTWCHVV